jgi:hypothetical protein
MNMKWRAWITRARRQWSTAFPPCALPACGSRSGRWKRTLPRRGVWLHEAWYCSAECFEQAAKECFAAARLPVVQAPPVRHRIPLGLLMLSRDWLTVSQLRAALEAQRIQGSGALGHWLEKLGFASEAQVTAALGLQWACPVLPHLGGEDSRCSAMVPFRLQEQFCMLLVQFVPSARTLHVAFSQRVEYTALYAIEQVLRYRTEACLLGHSQMERALERVGREPPPGEMLFEGWRDVGEMARITRSYVMQVGGRAVRAAACGDYIWVRLQGVSDATNLLFRRPSRGVEPQSAPNSGSQLQATTG